MEIVKEISEQTDIVSDQVCISHVEIYKATIPLREPFIISLGPIFASENILIRLLTNSGRVGYGECSPYAYITGETQATCFAIAKELATLLKGENPFHIDKLIGKMDDCVAGNTTIKSAFDMALYDLIAQLANVPLYKYLGGSAEKKIFTDQTVGIADPKTMAEKALQITQKGIGELKIKLGTNHDDDVARIKAIREEVGDHVKIRIDANQGWDYTSAIQTLRSLEKYHIMFCEEPVPSWNVHDLARVRSKSPIPIMADESLFDHHDAMKLVRTDAVDYFNIKLAKSGGIFKALKILHVAESAGIKCQIGAMGESRLAMTAAAHLGLSSKHLCFFDLDPPFMQKVDPILGGLVYGDKGQVIISNASGLGVTLDPEYLKGLEREII